MELVEGGGRVVLGIGLPQVEAPSILELFVARAQGLDQWHEGDARLADLDLEQAPGSVELIAVGEARAGEDEEPPSGSSANGAKTAVRILELRLDW